MNKKSIVNSNTENLSGTLSRLASEHKWKLILSGIAIATIGGIVITVKVRPHYKIMKKAVRDVGEKYSLEASKRTTK